MKTQARWSSRFMFILAATGAAVGLGNIWKFPYMAGDYGGSAFVLLYLLCVAFIGLPAMIAEITLGKLGRQNPIDTLRTLAKQYGASAQWRWVGFVGTLALLMVLSFYSVISGWSIAYIGYAAMGLFQNTSVEGIQMIWASLIANPGLLIGLHALFLAITLWVVRHGVTKGIERASKWMMPLLFLSLVVLMIYGIWQGDFKAGWNFLFAFDARYLTSEVLIAAMGHAFFTLAVGAGAMLVYGAYLPPTVPLASTVTAIAILDAGIAFMAGLAIFPLVFAHGLTPEAGPGLMFKVLPIALMNMPFGQWIGVLFFVLLLFAAWTSSISMAEPLVMIATERFGWSRLKAAWAIGIITFILGVTVALSFNVWSHIQFLGRYGIFDMMTDIPTNILLPIGGLGFTLFTLWCIPAKTLKSALGVHSFFQKLWWLVTRYISPLGIFLVLIYSLRW